MGQRDITGIILLDKPQGSTSNQALQRVRRLFGAAKAGHTGSLDPLATGLLPVCFGEATKIAGLLLGSAKAYETECRLGVVTDTDDAQGAVTVERPVPPLAPDAIVRALAELTGRIVQVPPVYSAIKRDGEPLYKLARRASRSRPRRARWRCGDSSWSSSGANRFACGWSAVRVPMCAAWSATSASASAAART